MSNSDNSSTGFWFTPFCIVNILFAVMFTIGIASYKRGYIQAQIDSIEYPKRFEYKAHNTHRDTCTLENTPEHDSEGDCCNYHKEWLVKGGQHVLIK